MLYMKCICNLKVYVYLMSFKFFFFAKWMGAFVIIFVSPFVCPLSTGLCLFTVMNFAFVADSFKCNKWEFVLYGFSHMRCSRAGDHFWI